MRVSPPDSLALRSRALLRDVRERLAERHPDLEAALDPTHPAWLVLQEAAWMVEQLSGQLDRYPWSVLQQLAHLLGARLQPAQPAIGVGVLEARTNGLLDLEEDPGRYRFFAPRTETRDLVEMALAERHVEVAAGRLKSLARVVDGELHRVADPPTAPSQAVYGPLVRSQVFGAETFTWTLLASAADRLDTLLEGAAERLLTERRIGWLTFAVHQDADRVVLRATLDVSAAFRGLPGITPGGDVPAAWGTLDDSTWTPPVRVADHPLLPRALRGTRPLAGEEADQLLVPDVPSGVATAELLVRDASPAPAELIDAIWTTLVHLETRLAPLRPVAVRGVRSQDDEPGWVDQALRSSAWPALVDRGQLSLATLSLTASSRGRTVRVGWIEPGERCRAFALDEHGLRPDALGTRILWQERLPDAQGQLRTVRVLLVEVPAGVTGLVLASDGVARAVLFNPVLLVNAPIVRDGRTLTLQRAVPEPVNLLYKDIVTPAVLARLGRSGLDPSICRILGELPTARLETSAGPIDDFVGVAVDPGDGLLTLNAPDDEGRLTPLKRGANVRVAWYRRTDATLAELPPGTIRLVEQPPSASPRLLSVDSPLGTSHGMDRESEQAAVQRIFGPPMPTPVTPGDWERLVRHALGPRGAGWLVRVWSYAERALMRTAVWPPPGLSQEDGSDELRDALRTAGPETLLVVLGPPDLQLAPRDLGWARTVVEGLVAEQRDRVPLIRAALVSPLWGLTLKSDRAPALPCHGLIGLRGTLSDVRGRSGPVPAATLLLNGAIVEVLPDGP